MKTGPEKAENYIEAGLIVDAQIHEAVCNFIVERFAGGLILDDKEDTGQVGITFYIAEGEHSGFEKLLVDYIRNRCGDEKFSDSDIKTRKIANLEWIQVYRDSIKPVEIGRLYIHPPWMEASKRHDIDLIIEPRMAFGTGNHESTRLCLLDIMEYLDPGDSFFDLGCGSG
ncbi:MAG: 50S ribosomal protein L11 methyltransferase, partial [Candidatus Zixiibacteriota bacterium]